MPRPPQRRPPVTVPKKPSNPWPWILGGLGMAALVFLSCAGGIGTMVYMKFRRTQELEGLARLEQQMEMERERQRQFDERMKWEPPVVEVPPPKPADLDQRLRPEPPQLPWDVKPLLPEEPKLPAPLFPAGQPDPRLLQGDTRVFLNELSEQTIGAQQVGKNGVLVFNGQELPIAVNTVKSPHGLGMFLEGAGSCKVRYSLGNKAQVFRSVVAFNDLRQDSLGSAKFSVRGDGKLLWESALVQRKYEPQECHVDVSGVDLLELEVRAADGSRGSSPAVWVEPVLYKDAAEARKEPALLPMRINARITGKNTWFPDATEVNEPFAAGPAQKVNGVSITRLKPKTLWLASGCVCWAPDGKSFFFLHGETGRLSQVTLEGLREVRRLEINRKCSRLCMSAEGLLVTTGGEIWIVDIDRLRVKTRLQAPFANGAVSAPSLTLAFSVSSLRRFSEPPRVQIFDLKTGERLESGPLGSPGPNLPAEIRYYVVSPDGKYLFTGHSAIHRYRIEKTGIVYEQSTPAIASTIGLSSLCVSPDGKYVCLPSYAGNLSGLPNHPVMAAPGAYVYSVTDLQRPVFTLEVTNGVIAFDPAASQIYGGSLTIFQQAGIKLKEVKSDKIPEASMQIIVHPSGRKLLVVGDAMAYVEIPELRERLK